MRPRRAVAPVCWHPVGRDGSSQLPVWLRGWVLRGRLGIQRGSQLLTGGRTGKTRRCVIDAAGQRVEHQRLPGTLAAEQVGGVPEPRQVELLEDHALSLPIGAPTSDPYSVHEPS